MACQKPGSRAIKNAVDGPAIIAPTQRRNLALNASMNRVSTLHKLKTITVVRHLELHLIEEYGLDASNGNTEIARSCIDPFFCTAFAGVGPIHQGNRTDIW